ncbi:hypothetical protein, partial [Enterobacter hormaechei]|uniref:hypothetical protein n=1 Tax=Enterobacter hormaechei TaxID=158836 RepID=UPI0020411C2B
LSAITTGCRKVDDDVQLAVGSHDLASNGWQLDGEVPERGRGADLLDACPDRHIRRPIGTKRLDEANADAAARRRGPCL